MFCVQYMIVLWGSPLLLPIRVLELYNACRTCFVDAVSRLSGCQAQLIEQAENSNARVGKD